jgi:type II secretion system protein G
VYKWLAKRIHRDEKGFTLIELLVVVAIIALLAVFAVPKVFDAIQQAKGARGNNDIAIIQAALDRFYMDHDFYPNNMEELVTRKYLKHNVSFRNGFDRMYLYAVNDNTGTPVWDAGAARYTTKGNATAYFLADPGRSPITSVEICNARTGSQFNQGLPEGQIFENAGVRYSYGWSSYRAGSQITIATTCGTPMASPPPSLHQFRTDGYTE